jgi:hypothetical protein
MPRLSDSTVTAYPEGNGNGNIRTIKLLRLFTILLLILLLHNICFKDYRNDEINILRQSGLTQDEINNYVGQPNHEEIINEKKKKLNEYDQLKLDVKRLKHEMGIIKSKLGYSDADFDVDVTDTTDGTDRTDGNGNGSQGKVNGSSSSNNNNDTNSNKEEGMAKTKKGGEGKNRLGIDTV